MKIKQKYLFTKQKRVNFTAAQWEEAMQKALREHPELADADIKTVENLKATTKVDINGTK